MLLQLKNRHFGSFSISHFAAEENYNIIQANNDQISTSSSKCYGLSIPYSCYIPDTPYF